MSGSVSGLLKGATSKQGIVGALTGNPIQTLGQAAKANSVPGQGTFEAGGAANQILDPLDFFGGTQKGQQQQQQSAYNNAAGAPLPDFGSGSSPPGGMGGNPGAPGSMAPWMGQSAPSSPAPVLAPQLLPNPDRTVQPGQMPLTRDRAFSQVLGPLQQPNWGNQQINPAYLTGIQRTPNGQLPPGTVWPSGFGQMPQQMPQQQSGGIQMQLPISSRFSPQQGGLPMQLPIAARLPQQQGGLPMQLPQGLGQAQPQPWQGSPVMSL